MFEQFGFPLLSDLVLLFSFRDALKDGFCVDVILVSLVSLRTSVHDQILGRECLNIVLVVSMLVVCLG